MAIAANDPGAGREGRSSYGTKSSRVLSDQDIVVKVNLKSKEATGWYDSRLSKERMRVLEYYNGTLPRKAHMGSASYVDPSVFDAVEMMKAQILEVFAGGDDIAQFDADQDMSVADCRAATQYCRYVLFQQNQGFQLFNNVITDALLARCGVVKIYWDECSEHVDEEFDGLQHDDAMALATQDDVEEFEAEQDEETGLYKGTLLRKKDRSKVCIEAMAPEEFLIEPRCVSLENAGYSGHRTLKTKADLLDMGYRKDLVERVHYDDARGLDLSPEVLARNAPVETVQALQNPIQPEMEKVMLYESYVRMQIDPKKGARLYKVVHAADVLFEYQEVNKTPFIVFNPIPAPHRFYGENYAARVIPFQNAKTVLVRSVLDHASISTNPRWQVVKGGLLNPREMIDNRLGGLVNVSREGTVSALEVPALNPFVFEIVKKLSDDQEQSTGISSLSQGLNKDAISKQNSQGLVDQLVTLSGQRQKIIARHFAYDFFVPLMLEIMRLVCAHEKKEKILEVAGQPIRITPEQWSQRTTCTVSMHLGYGEKEQAMAIYEKLYQGMSMDPILSQGFAYQGRMAMFHDAAKIKGVNITQYLLPPDQVKPPQPDPIKMTQAQAQQTSAQAAMLTAQANQEKDKRLEAFDAGRLQLEQGKLLVTSMDHDRTHDRQDAETAKKMEISEREMALEEQMRPEELKGIVAPNP